MSGTSAFAFDCCAVITQIPNSYAKTTFRQRRLAPLVSNEGRDVGRGVGLFRKIQLHADAVWIVEEELRIARARHDALAEFHAMRLQTLAHGVDIGRGE